MPMYFTSGGIFFPDEIKKMRAELDAGTVLNETAAERDDRATTIIARHRIRKSEQELPQH